MSLIKLPFDRTGALTSNRVIDEPYEFTVTGIHVLISKQGLFYTNDVIVKDQSTGRELDLGLDFEFVSMDPDIAALTGLEAAAGIQLKDLNYAGTLLLTVQVVGGAQGVYSSFVKELSDAIAAAGDSINVDWVDIKNKPSHYPHAIHTHPISELEELDKIKTAFAELATAMKDRRPMSSSVQNLREQQDRTIMLLGQFRKSLNSLIAVTGSAQQIVDVKNQVDNIASRVDKQGTGLQGFSSTLGVWPIDEISLVSAVVLFKTGSKAHSMQVDIICDGNNTRFTRSNELFTVESLFSISVSESSGNVRLELTPVETGDFSVKWLVNI